MSLLDALWENRIIRWAIVISAILFIISIILMILGFFLGFALLGASLFA